jgi:hypothetical protein
VTSVGSSSFEQGLAWQPPPSTEALLGTESGAEAPTSTVTVMSG